MDSDQEMEVPCHFLCPISLQLMRDPVTLSTGITYDRHSIQAWLFSSRNNSCPVTKQPLRTLTLIPNLTLRSLIHAAGLETLPITPKPPVDDRIAGEILRQATAGDIESLRRLSSAAAEGGERGRNCLVSAGAIELLVTILQSESEKLESGETAEIAVEALWSLVDSGLSRAKRLFGALECIALVMGSSGASVQARTHAAALLMAAVSAAEPESLAGLTAGVFSAVTVLIRDAVSLRATKSALKVLLTTCRWGRNRAKASECGAVEAIVELLLVMSPSESSYIRLTELAVGAVEILCGCAEGRAGLVSHAAGLAVLSEKVMLRVSPIATDRAVRAVAAVCCRPSATPKVLREMLAVGVVSRLCMVAGDSCSQKTKTRALRVLALHSLVWRASNCIPPHLLSFYPLSSSS